jgi:multidrug resistance efflux pump
VLRLAKETKIAPAKIEASLAEVSAEEETLRRELAQLEAQVALAQADLPKAEEIAQVCRAFAQGAATASAQKRRDILDALEAQVSMSGLDYTITGIVPELERRGTLGASTSRSLARVRPQGHQCRCGRRPPARRRPHLC